jgi:plastocyanin
MRSGKIYAAIAVAFFIWTGSAAGGTIKGVVSAVRAENNGNAVIYVAAIPGKTFTAPKEHAVMDQKNMKFIPHILPVLAGTTVDFKNSDDLLHNVFSPEDCAGAFNLGNFGKGMVRSHTFTKADCFAVILCNLHPEMEAFVAVLPTPFFAVSSPDGNFEIENVPAGKYTVNIWHETLKGQPAAVEVPGKGSVVVNFVLQK